MANEKKVLLGSDDIDALTRAYFQDSSKVEGGFQELMKVDSMWDRVKREQAKQSIRHMVFVLRKSLKRASRRRGAFSGKTVKTALKRAHADGECETIEVIILKLAKMLNEVSDAHSS